MNKGNEIDVVHSVIEGVDGDNIDDNEGILKTME